MEFTVARRRGIGSPGRMIEDMVLEVSGVRITGCGNPDRLVVEADLEAAGEISRRFGRELVVEQTVDHRVQV